MKITKQKLIKWDKKELIEFALLRNEDAHNYSERIERLEKENELLKDELNLRRGILNN